jgi:hypothetical protein
VEVYPNVLRLLFAQQVRLNVRMVRAHKQLTSAHQ